MRRALLLGAVCVVAGCGGGEDPAPQAAAAPAAKPLGEARGGSVAQYADCGDWRGGSRAERMATIVELRDQLTPQRSKSAASPLPDEEAYAVFQRACAPSYAESLRLYKLYVKVQGFAPLRD